MGKIKEFFHDEIERASRETDDYEYQYNKWCTEQQELERQRYFENQLKFTKWQKLRIQFKVWKFQFISIILRIFRIG
ncbi:MAG: hypothetical protein UR43_C0019G0004 [candidate division TM6 bacterium GW2011_GWF2_33_332]|nr:MAG: hypothetical protein UR43_C0019G0004 [candidate division TM6 bacterium GW2011_GWF2_33_332]